MAIGTPFHPRTAALCTSHAWRRWSGHLAASSYGDFVPPEYAAIRNATAMIDVSPLYKYSVEGRDAGALLDRVVTHDIGRLEPGQALYTPWCDRYGKVRQDGTVFRLDADRYLLNAAEPAIAWLHESSRGLSVEIADHSRTHGGAGAPGTDLARPAELAHPFARIDLRARLLPPGRDLARRRSGDGLAHRLHRRPRLRGLGRGRSRARAVGRIDRRRSLASG